jgi:dTDP-4-dehydrorhamnose reductase
MRIYITGANGQLANCIIDLLREHILYKATSKILDVTNRKKVINSISKFHPDLVLHFASKTRGDECARDPEEAYKINVVGTKNIVEACLKTDAAILFVSTNEVFDGEKKKPYIEEDTPNPITVVGKTKLEAEDIIRKNMKKYFIIRTMWLYSKWSCNFLQAVFKIASEKKSLELVDDEIGSPTNSLDLAAALIELIKTTKYGIYHLTNKGEASRLEFAKKAFELKDVKNVSIKPIKLSQYKRLSMPPHYSVLDNKNGTSINIYLRKWEDALKDFLSDVDLT